MEQITSLKGSISIIFRLFKPATLALTLFNNLHCYSSKVLGPCEYFHPFFNIVKYVSCNLICAKNKHLQIFLMKQTGQNYDRWPLRMQVQYIAFCFYCQNDNQNVFLKADFLKNLDGAVYS